ncbi:MAG: endo alpha-1,4 polygalactosaminidase [Candidatus Dormibacteria bacterium]
MRWLGRLTPILGAAILASTAAACAGPHPAPTSAQAHPGHSSSPTWWTPTADLGPFVYQLQGLPTDRATGGIQVGECQTPPGAPACVQPRVYDIDLYVDSSVSGRNDVLNRRAVAAIHAAGAFAVCYVDAGTWESWRPDARRFPASVLGRRSGWPGERWLDIRRLNVLLPIMMARARGCARAGFNAIDWDNVDGYQNRTGFRLTAPEQLRYNLALAKIAHQLGLAAGLKNDYGRVAALAGTFDFGVDEQCSYYRECSALTPFLKLGKPVYDVEYTAAAFCPATKAQGIWAALQAPSLYPSPWLPCEARLPSRRTTHRRALTLLTTQLNTEPPHLPGETRPITHHISPKP